MRPMKCMSPFRLRSGELLHSVHLLYQHTGATVTGAVKNTHTVPSNGEVVIMDQIMDSVHWIFTAAENVLQWKTDNT